MVDMIFLSAALFGLASVAGVITGHYLRFYHTQRRDHVQNFGPNDFVIDIAAMRDEELKKVISSDTEHEIYIALCIEELQYRQNTVGLN